VEVGTTPVACGPNSPLPLGLGRIVLLAVIDTGARAPIMGHTHSHGPRTAAPVTIISRETHSVDAPIARPTALGPQQDLIPLEHGIRARISLAQPLHRLILRRRSDGEGDLVIVRIAHTANHHSSERVWLSHTVSD
jgi:hypothetical protein